LERGQSVLHPNEKRYRQAMKHDIGDTKITLQNQLSVLSRCFGDYPDLFDHKPIWDWAAQINWYCSHFRQFYF